MDAESRIADYKAILADDTLTPEKAIVMYDMLSADIHMISELERERETMLKEMTALRDTNHKLFLRVTSDTTTHETKPDDVVSAQERFYKMIQEGKI